MNRKTQPRKDEMPNDAKLGLLAGVIGVIAVAVVSAGGPTSRNTPAHPPAAASTHQPALAANTQDPSPQFPRTRPEPDGMPASHQAHDEDQ